jgi:translation initiation factor 2B subunit (eIF-2B alpha/beta/delta family)
VSAGSVGAGTGRACSGAGLSGISSDSEGALCEAAGSLLLTASSFLLQANVETTSTSMKIVRAVLNKSLFMNFLHDPSDNIGLGYT